MERVPCVGSHWYRACRRVPQTPRSMCPAVLTKLTQLTRMCPTAPPQMERLLIPTLWGNGSIVLQLLQHTGQLTLSLTCPIYSISQTCQVHFATSTSTLPMQVACALLGPLPGLPLPLLQWPKGPSKMSIRSWPLPSETQRVSVQGDRNSCFSPAGLLRLLALHSRLLSMCHLFLPQGLCTHSSLCLDHSFLASLHSCSFWSLKSRLKCLILPVTPSCSDPVLLSATSPYLVLPGHFLTIDCLPPRLDYQLPQGSILLSWCRCPVMHLMQLRPQDAFLKNSSY